MTDNAVAALTHELGGDRGLKEAWQGCWPAREVSRTRGMLHVYEGEVARDDDIFFGDVTAGRARSPPCGPANCANNHASTGEHRAQSQGCEES